MLKLITKYQTSFLLILILILGFFLRINNIEYNSLWLDELFTVNFSHPSKDFSSMLKLTLEDVHPPLYQTILWLWLKVFDITEFNLRILSLIIGLFSILAIYMFAKELFNKNISLFISFIFSTNIFIIFFSQEARSYQLTLLLSILSFFYLYKTLVYKENKNLYLYWIVTILWMYTHYFSFFIILSQIVFVILFIIFFAEEKIKLLKIKLYTAIIFFISLVPLLPYILATTKDNSFWWMPKPNNLYFIDYIHIYFGYGGIFFVLFGFLISIYFIIITKLEKKEKIFIIMLSIWLVCGYLFPYINSIYNFSILQDRYTIVMIPPIVLLSIFGISKLKNSFQILIMISFIIFSYKVLFIDHKNSKFKQDYKKVLQYISKYNSIPIYELIPENGHRGNNTNHFQVYSNLLNLKLEIKDDFLFKKEYSENKLPECFWIIYTFYSPELKSTKDIFNINKIKNYEKATLIHKKQFYRAEALLFSNKKENSCKRYLDEI